MNGDSYGSRESRHGSTREPREYHGSRDDRGDDRRDRRRRSRSPGHRGSRRDYEVDQYSSSRDYREREREDRYAGRDRRGGEREWDRDRGPRHERRGEDDRRGGGRRDNRDRDLFDDRGGRGERGERGERGGRGGREDRDGGFGGRRNERKRSASPPPKKKEPTPDLTDIIPITERKRRLTQWDIKPPGYENVTAEQAKLSGMFPLPGAPRQQPMDPSRLQAFMNQPAGSAASAALKPSNARQSKRLFVYNIPAAATEDSITDFFNLQLNGLNVVDGVDPCISAQIGKDREFALVEFKTPEDSTTALAMDGITMEDTDNAMNGASNGSSAGLQIRRPKDYIVPAPLDDIEMSEGEVSSVVKDSAQKISITHIAPFLTDEQVKELLDTFGQLRSFVLVKDRDTEQSRGIAFCEYANEELTAVALEGLNGMEIGDSVLKVQKACVGFQQASGLEMGVNAMSMLAGTTSTDLEHGRVLQLLNMVTPEELLDNEEYEEIVADVREECEKYGQVLDLKVPRPSGPGRQANGVGKIFVKFEDTEAAEKALAALAGRKFADRTVVVTYFGEEYFDVNAW